MNTLQIQKQFFLKRFLQTGNLRYILFLFFLVVPITKVVAQVRLMPLGNSITEGEGSSHGGGYRHDLYYLLRDAKISFNFVGAQRYGTDFPDIDHEGHPGFYAEDLQVRNYLKANPAAAVLLEIGTNDITGGKKAVALRNDIARLIEIIHDINSATAVYLSTVVPRRDNVFLQAEADALNALLPDLVRDKFAAGYNIYLVDNASRFKAHPNWKNKLLADGKHPNNAGYAMMAELWFEAFIANAKPNAADFSDDFNQSTLDRNRWLRGSYSGNLAKITGNALELRAQGVESAWVVTRQAYPCRNSTVKIKVLRPNEDGMLGMSPTYTLAAPNGIYDQASWYRFYVYRNSHSGPYRLYVQWKKNGIIGGLDVTGNIVINAAVYLRFRFDGAKIYFEASLNELNWTKAYSENFDLPGYTLDSPFHYELSAYDTNKHGVLVVDDFSITTLPGESDTQPPQISQIVAQNITTNSAQIKWQTDEPADSQVEYGLTNSYDSSSPLNAARVTAHTVTLSGLQANSIYHYRVKSKDAAGNLAISSDFTFTTTSSADVIFADDFNAGALNGNHWRTGANSGNQAAVLNKVLALRSDGESSWVITRTAYAARNSTVEVKVVQPNNDGNLGMSPTFKASSRYGIYDQANWYRFYSYRNNHSGPYRLYVQWKKKGVEAGLDVTGNLVISGAFYLRLRFDQSKIYFEASLDGASWTETYSETFDLPGYTLDSPFYYELAGFNTSANGVLKLDDFSIDGNNAAPDKQAPQISNVAVQNITSNNANIVWQTDEPADSQIEYGQTSAYGSSTPVNSKLVAAHSVALDGLQANTVYHYRVKSKDAAGNSAASNDLTFKTLSPANAVFADDFNAGSLDANKWRAGTNAGNQVAVANKALELRSRNAESGWVVTRNTYAARNTTVQVKMVQPNEDGDLGMSPTYNPSSRYGIYDQANWYRFYTYRNGNGGAHRLYIQWKKNGVEDGFDVTGSLVIKGAVYLRLRFDNSKIHFEASLDGASWINTYSETFALPGYSLDTRFYYELSAYNTVLNSVLAVDDFSISSDTPSSLAAKPEATEQALGSIPASFALQNYPNPFNAATNILFSLPQDAEIDLAIFDMAGREVQELAAESRRAGIHEVRWDGKNRDGAVLSTGFYLVRLRYRVEAANEWSRIVRQVMMVK